MDNPRATRDGIRSRAEDTGSEGLPLRDYLGILRRRIWVMLAVFVILFTLGTVYVFKATPIYQGVARILIERQTPRATNFEDVMQAPNSEQDYYKTQEELLRSRTVMEKALEEPGMDALPEVAGDPEGSPSLLDQVMTTVRAVIGAPPEKPGQPWERLRDCLAVEQVKGTHLLAAKARSNDPERAAHLANAVARAFEKYHVERKLAVNNDAFRFLQDQKAKQEEQLLKAEADLQEFREKAQVVSLDLADKQNPVLNRQAELNAQLTKVRIRRVELASQVDGLNKALTGGTRPEAGGTRPGGFLSSVFPSPLWPLASGPRAEGDGLFSVPAVRKDEVVAALQKQLMVAESKAAEIKATYGPSHPQVRSAAAAAAQLQADLHRALSQAADGLRAELAAVAAQEQEFQRQCEEQNKQALEMAARSLDFGRLASEVERQRKLFDVLVERMREVSVTTDYGRTNVEVVEAAVPPKDAYRPRKALVMVLAAFLGLVLSVASALFLEYVDDTVKTPEDLDERVGVPVLGFVPEMESRGLEGEADFHRNLAVLVEPNSHITEAYRSIRTNLFYAAPADQTRVVVVTSGGPGDGKTTTATNLALVIARSGKRVLLIDADLRRPMVHRIFGLRPGRGLSTVLVGGATLEEAVQQARHDGEAIENLDILPAGPKPPNPAELLDSVNMRLIIEQARRSYDRVIIDTPPVLFVADTSVVAGLADGVVLVVKSAANPRSMATRARDQLLAINARILGGVLNDVYIGRLDHYESSYGYYGYSRTHGVRAESYYSAEEPGEGLDGLEEAIGEINRAAAEVDEAASELSGTPVR